MHRLSLRRRYPQGMGIEPDPSESFDLVTAFASADHDAEMQALAVLGLLRAGGIPAVMAGASVIPTLPFEVRVPRSRLEEARVLIAEAQAAGPGAADEAERASEGTD